ncbi:MAG: hypothetical protein CMJ25_22515 [Phycisphaerae bacterium]|nr:hypothetical protein [Phycisphaerae bacterium]|tara:strand:- start:2367 stop:4028 length:1662 start_codon:yes stop_codon:yes gene_type:complete
MALPVIDFNTGRVVETDPFLATEAADFSMPQSGFGQIAGGLGNIFGGLMGAGQSVLNSPDALMGLAGGLLTKESYDRLSDIGSQAKQEAMGLAERGQRESEFKPFTVTTPTGAMFTSRMGGQPSMGQPTMFDARPIEPGPLMMMPPGMDEREAFRQGLLGQPVGGLLPEPLTDELRPRVSSPYDGMGDQLRDMLGIAPGLIQAGPQKRRIGDIDQITGMRIDYDAPPGMSARPARPGMETADIGFFVDPITGQQGTGSTSYSKYRRKLKDYYDKNPGAQQYYEGLERQAQTPTRQPSPSMGGLLQNLTGMLPAQPTTGGLEVGMTLSPQEQALQQQLLGGAGGFFGQAAQPTMDREQAVFERIRAAQRPEEQRQRLALEERLAAQGRLGTSSAAYGGATPELMAQQTAIQESRNQAMLSAMQQAQAEQAQQAALGQTFLGSGYMPQQALLEAAMPGIMQQELAQQGQQFGTGLFAETGLSGIEAQLLQEQARANLLGGIGGNLISGIINQQRAATAAPSSSGGGSSLGGLFGDVIGGLGDVGSGIKSLLGIGG